VPPVATPDPTATRILATAGAEKTVRLWIGNPFGWPKGGPPSQVAFCTVLAELERLRDVVDEITVRCCHAVAMTTKPQPPHTAAACTCL
jgi:hypothetical protein